MSNRTLIELNHDHASAIRANPADVGETLARYMRSGDANGYEARMLFLDYGIRVIGMRHHSDAYKIQWGSHEAEQETRTVR